MLLSTASTEKICNDDFSLLHQILDIRLLIATEMQPRRHSNVVVHVDVSQLERSGSESSDLTDLCGVLIVVCLSVLSLE